MPQIALRLPDALYVKVRAAAESNDLMMSEFIRDALRRAVQGVSESDARRFLKSEAARPEG